MRSLPFSILLEYLLFLRLTCASVYMMISSKAKLLLVDPRRSMKAQRKPNLGIIQVTQNSGLFISAKASLTSRFNSPCRRSSLAKIRIEFTIPGNLLSSTTNKPWIWHGRLLLELLLAMVMLMEELHIAFLLIRRYDLQLSLNNSRITSATPWQLLDLSNLEDNHMDIAWPSCNYI